VEFLDDSGCGGDKGGPYLGQVEQELFPAFGQDRGYPGIDHHIVSAHSAAHMAKGKKSDGNVRTVGRKMFIVVLQEIKAIRMGQHHAFRRAGGAGGVNHGHHIFRLN